MHTMPYKRSYAACPCCSRVEQIPGQISLSVRDAINFGLFDGPRVTAAGRYLTTRQGLTDWYPTWIGVMTGSSSSSTLSLMY